MSGKSQSFIHTWTGDGADIVIPANLPLKSVEIINETDGVILKKTNDMAAGKTIQIAVDGAISTVADGITIDGMNIELVAALNVDAKVFYLKSFS
ncbi:MAG: hypothetical protein ACTSQZ_01985 [Candidatus Thorarchaeota archaeon]